MEDLLKAIRILEGKEAEENEKTKELEIRPDYYPFTEKWMDPFFEK